MKWYKGDIGNGGFRMVMAEGGLQLICTANGEKVADEIIRDHDRSATIEELTALSVKVQLDLQTVIDECDSWKALSEGWRALALSVLSTRKLSSGEKE